MLKGVPVVEVSVLMEVALESDLSVPMELLGPASELEVPVAEGDDDFLRTCGNSENAGFNLKVPCMTAMPWNVLMA